MNVRRRRSSGDEAEVMLSPLIDCVFLLLIFFLVTSMIKRFERQIPVTLADDTSAITPEPLDDSYPIGVDRLGGLHGPADKTWSGVTTFVPLEKPSPWLSALIAQRGGAAPVTVVVERGTPFQKVINVQDQLETTGFKNIRFRLRDFPFGTGGDASREVERERRR